MRIIRDDRGLTSVEYVVLLVLVCLAGVAGWNVFGQGLRCKLAGASESFDRGLAGGASAGPLEQCASDGTEGLVSAGTSSGAGSVIGSAGAGSDTRGAGTHGEDRQALPEVDQGRAPKKPSTPAPNKAAVAAAWAKQVKRLLCPDSAALLKDMKNKGATVTLYDRIYWEDPYYDGTQWTTKLFEGAGSASGGDLKIIRGGGTADSAATLFHEGTHFQQPSSMTRQQKEYDAYTKEEVWRQSKGLPPHHSSFRKHLPNSKVQTDHAAIRAYVDREYPITTAPSAGGAGADEVVGKDAHGNTVFERPNGTQYSRPPQRGDTFAGPQTTVPAGGIPVDMALLQC